MLIQTNIIPMLKYSLVSAFVLFLFATKTISAQPGDTIDSLITVKKNFNTSEKIEFTIKINNKLKKKLNQVRLVPTISCSCNNKDFYYVVYSIENANRKIVVNHTEKSDAKKCDCKTYYAEFYNNKKQNIPPVTQKGNYIIEISGVGFTMYSNVFTITD